MFFEDSNSLVIKDRGDSVEVCVLEDREVVIVININNGEADWDSRCAWITITAAEATAIRKFLIKQGF